MSEKKHPIVFRFASIYPAALARIEMHARRSGGPLDNIELAFSDRNKVHVGPTFAKEVRAEIRQMKRQNLDEEVAACHARRRKKEAKAREEMGLTNPWHGNSQGPIREVVVTAHWQYFEVEIMSDLDDVLTTYGVDPNGKDVVHTLSKKKIAAFEEATLEFFEKYFPGAVRHLRLDLDEETPHFHAVLFVTAETTNKTRGMQRLIQPSAHPLLADYELAQDVAGEHFSKIGLVRGQKRAQEVRDAKESDLPLPDAVRHVPPREYRNARARAIRAKELNLRDRENDLDLRQAEIFLDEVALDASLADAEGAERRAEKKERHADEKLSAASEREAEVNAYADAMTEGLEAILDHRLEYTPAEHGQPEGLEDGPEAEAQPSEEQGRLWTRIQPAYGRLVRFARQAFRLRERVFAVRRSEADVTRRAAVVADAESRNGRPVSPGLQEILDASKTVTYEVEDFPGAWAIQAHPDPRKVKARLDEMSNRGLRDCFLATRDAAEITVGQQEIHAGFDRGQQLLKWEAGRRGFDLETGRHDPCAASDPERARLHTDEDVQAIRITLPGAQRQRVRQ
ncbi:hypothetical protein [Rubellimicrobium arenae]|uniref:hypothetical protein n=1 Tax=Rubellimicrobium arenae TaxID=2817372 RepID=UPI001B315F33|nr:hypothetical protein [Rubellimicrobium arenae]